MTNATTMSFLQQPELNINDTQQQQQKTQEIKARARTAGHRHGKAFGNAGAAAANYSIGFAQGFMSAFQD